MGGENLIGLFKIYGLNPKIFVKKGVVQEKKEKLDSSKKQKRTTKNQNSQLKKNNEWTNFPKHFE